VLYRRNEPQNTDGYLSAGCGVSGYCGQGERGLIRVLDFFTWEKKIDILSQWYAELLEE
jgi:hypothetical protein